MHHDAIANYNWYDRDTMYKNPFMWKENNLSLFIINWYVREL